MSHGYIVVAISHTLWTPVTTFADGSTISMTRGTDASDSAILSAAGVWLADARFVLDEFVKMASSDPDGEIEGHVDLTKVLANSLHLKFSDFGILAEAVQLGPSLRQSNMLGTIDPVRGVQQVNGYVQVFFDFALKGAPSPLLEGPTAEYPDVVNFSKKP